LQEAQLREALGRLAEAELIFGRGVPPRATYTFKHALVRDAAYDSLLKSRRQLLHARIAEALERLFPATVEAEPGVLAQHCTEAGMPEKAVAYWLRAGQQAMRRAGTGEAIAQLTKGLDVLAGLPEGVPRSRHALDLQATLASALIAAKGFGASEAGHALSRARELCRELPDSPQLTKVLDGQCVFHIVRSEVAASLAVGQELLALAEQRGDPVARLIGHRGVGWALTVSGEPAQGKAHLEQALALYEPARHVEIAVYHPFDSFVGSTTFLSLALAFLGHPDQALLRGEDAVAAARQIRHPYTLALALFFNGVLHQLLDLRPEVRARAEELVVVGTEHDAPMWLARADILCGWALAAEGASDAGPSRLCRGLENYLATGARLWLPYFSALRAEAEAQPAASLQLLDSALACSQRTGERWFEAELHRRRGEALLALAADRAAEAEACCGRAVAFARRRHARYWELRAVTSLAAIWAERGERARAHDLLGRVLGRFTEGSVMPHLVEAKALLGQLA
jgi:predicted ATPase